MIANGCFLYTCISKANLPIRPSILSYPSHGNSRPLLFLLKSYSLGSVLQLQRANTGQVALDRLVKHSAPGFYSDRMEGAMPQLRMECLYNSGRPEGGCYRPRSQTIKVTEGTEGGFCSSNLQPTSITSSIKTQVN